MATARDYADLNRRTSDQVATIRANINLSTEGRQRLIAEVYAKAATSAQDMRVADAAANAKSRQAAESRLFGLSWQDRGNPSAVISMRDAVDRASRIESEAEAVKLLQRAVITEDTALQKALLGRAFEAGFVSVVDKYIEHRPDTVEDIDELIHDNAANDLAASAAGKLVAQAATYVVRPAELNGLADNKVQQLAAEAATVTETPPAPTFENKTLAFTGGQLRVAGDNQPSVDF